MPALKDKVRHALNEARILILGTQVLIGFHYRSVLEPRFESLSTTGQWLSMAGLGLLLVAFGLLVAPAAYQCIVARGHATATVHRFTIVAVGGALVPLALALATSAYIVAYRIDVVPPLAAAVVVIVTTLAFWFAWPLALRRRGGGEGGETVNERTPLKDRIEQVLTEVRMVLPGAQALLGFGFAAILMENFDHLPQASQVTHLAGVGFVLLATILLMTPASRHRIAERGEDTEEFHRFTSRVLLVAMGALALGIAAQVLVVVRRVHESVPMAAAAAGLSVVFFFGLWFGLMGWLRARRRRVGPADTARREAA